jgi:hypothetical protein
VHGANVPWYNWGCGANGGVSSASTQITFGAGFARLNDGGGKNARWWVFPGDPWQITRDSAGAPTGVNLAVYADFDAALRLAKTYDLYYDFVLFSGPSSIPTAWMIDDAQRAKLAAALGPLFARYKGHPRVLSWEIFNGPEWDIWNNKIAQAPVQATVKAMATIPLTEVSAETPSWPVGLGHEAVITGTAPTWRWLPRRRSGKPSGISGVACRSLAPVGRALH